MAEKMKRSKQDVLSLINSSASFTPFQRKVYRAVLDIPKGSVRSYGWVAKKIGCPRAARAVGYALKKNPYTVTIPCHRVVRTDGSMGGYSKGVQEKKRLLKSEGYLIV